VLDEHPLHKSMLVYVRDRIATFLLEQVIAVRGKFHDDETTWANIVYSS
jgi:hypothetical protein